MDKDQKAELLKLLVDDTRGEYERRREHLQQMEDYFFLIFSDTEESDTESEADEDDKYKFKRKPEACGDNGIDSEQDELVEIFEVCSDEEEIKQEQEDIKQEQEEGFSSNDMQLDQDEVSSQGVEDQNGLDDPSVACSDETDLTANEFETVDLCEDDSFLESIYSCSDKEFKERLRLERSTVEYLITKYSKSEMALRPAHGGRIRMGPRKDIYAYLLYLGNTIAFVELGNLIGVTKSSAWTAVRRVSWWLISISHEYVKWPQRKAARESQRKFEQNTKMPSVIGAIDCSHIQIKKPKDNEKHYLNKVQNYSLIIQAVVDADRKFIDLTCGEPGSLSDSQVLQRSDFYSRVIKNVEEMFPKDTFLVCDSAYPATWWLLPPFMNYKSLSHSQRRFNLMHSATRKVVDEAFAMLKNRFRRLDMFTEQSNLCTLTNLIVSACVVHNICIIRGDIFEAGIPLLEETEDECADEDASSSHCAIADVTSHRRQLLFDQLINSKVI